MVGGGAGGLELATLLGNTLGRKGVVEVTLIDCSRTHLWKPLLHRVAAGSMDLNDHELDYLAQAAHQQATHLTKSLIRHIQGKPLKDWVYRDFGSLVSLGQYSTVGSLMGALTRGSLMIEGYFARLMYLSLYKTYEYTLDGIAKVFFDTLARLIVRQTEPHVKLH